MASLLRCRSAAAVAVAVGFLASHTVRAADTATASKDAPKLPLSEWYRGPVRYLIRRDEEKDFKSLKTDTERMLFIRDFWRERDPNPGTPENEARLAYWSRVREANELFRESARPGWLTDRGRIYILLGAPSDTDKDLDFRTGSQANSPGLLRWIYHGRAPGTRQDTTFVVAFVQDLSGEWRLSNDSRLSSIYFNPNSPQADPEMARMYPRLQSALNAVDPSDLSIMMDLGQAVQPPDETSLIDTISSATFYGAIPVSARWDFYPGTGDGRSLAVVTLFIPRAMAAGADGRLATILALARLETAAGVRVDLGEGSFTAEDQGDGTVHEEVLYQARSLVAPGGYNFYAGVFEMKGLRAGKASGAVDIPAFAPATAGISPLTPALSVQPVTRAADVGWALPFILGDLRVVPRREPVYSAREDFAVYFQLEMPPPGATGRQLELRFFRRDGENLIPAGKPQQLADPRPAQGWSFPLKGWPAGPYRLTVTLRGVSGADEATRSMDFTVAE